MRKSIINYMNWKESLGTVALFIILLQGVNWILTSLGLVDLQKGTLTFLISVILVSLVAIVVILIEQRKDIEYIKKRLKIRSKSRFKKMLKKKSKKGNIDPKILFWILIAILIYLFIKSLGLIK